MGDAANEKVALSYSITIESVKKVSTKRKNPGDWEKWTWFSPSMIMKNPKCIYYYNYYYNIQYSHTKKN